MASSSDEDVASTTDVDDEDYNPSVEDDDYLAFCKTTPRVSSICVHIDIFHCLTFLVNCFY